MIKKANMQWTGKKLARMATDGEIDFNISVQRGNVWKRDKQSLLIHSMITDYPIPPFYAVKNENGNYSMLDGKQRSEAIRAFLNNEFALDDSTPEVTLKNGMIDDISGLTYSQLCEEIQDKIKDYSLTVYWFDSCITDDEISEMFFRLNNGKPLSAIELTRVKAKSIDTIRSLAKHPIFSEALKETAINKYTNEDIIIKSWAILYADNKSLETKNIRTLTEQAEITQEQAEVIESVLTRLADTHAFIQAKAENVTDKSGEVDKAEQKRLNRINKRLYTRTHLISLIPITLKSINNNMSVSQFADWIMRFLDGKKFATLDEKYNNAAGSGSAKSESVKARLEAVNNSYMNYILTTQTTQQTDTAKAEPTQEETADNEQEEKAS
jgi:hypothetical protein